MITEVLRVPQVRDEPERRRVTAALTALAGVRHVQVNLADQTIRFERDERLPLAAILRALHAAGFDPIAVLA